nr:uncharacterized protein LOC101262462 [Solanum lycopersicum]XP_025883590.1 uncharacterized protein LOC101262462 [Solanum lycopersicum]XP_025883592.1 uncharacterized protein LOC101262462 [Solanum lycopersicum]XP_025883593.1 uncharacterized protein LOC101262462 [Solanum lycopersicum]XP_025883595.1 uncharacterized protein LOC101262462 [Solanum lycopersicum]
MEVNPSPIMPPAFPRIMEVNPSPITPPAETQPSVPISVEHPNLAAFIQYGISNLPVSNNPAMIRQKYSSIIRHSSLSKHMLHRNTNLQVIYQRKCFWCTKDSSHHHSKVGTMSKFEVGIHSGFELQVQHRCSGYASASASL